METRKSLTPFRHFKTQHMVDNKEENVKGDGLVPLAETLPSWKKERKDQAERHGSSTPRRQ